MTVKSASKALADIDVADAVGSRSEKDRLSSGFAPLEVKSVIPSTGTLGKAIAVLDAVASSDTPLRFTDLLALIPQPRGTLHRQVSNLIDEGLLELAPDQSYRVGVRLLRFAAKAWDRSDFRIVAAPHIQKLHNDTGETVHLGVLQDLDVVYLDKFESRQSVRMHSQIGNASPCYCTGVGKAALSVLAPDEASRRAERIDFKNFTPTTLQSAEALENELAEIRREGLAFDREEHETGIHCIAAPIRTGDPNVTGGLSVTAPAYRLPMKNLEQWGSAVKAAADAITEDLSLRMGPRNT